jgi:hypothetical protein
MNSKKPDLTDEEIDAIRNKLSELAEKRKIKPVRIKKERVKKERTEEEIEADKEKMRLLREKRVKKESNSD